MNPRIRSTMFVCLIVLVMTLAPFHVRTARAQVAGGTLAGTITDPSGAEVPNAQIVIKDLATGVERTVATNKEGFYIAANLLPAEYQVTVTATDSIPKSRMELKLTSERNRNSI